MEFFAGEITKAAIKLAADLIKERLSRRTTESGAGAIVANNIEGHLQEVLKWSERDQFFGMSIPHAIDKSTVALLLRTEPRRFASIKSEGTKGESDLLSDRESYLLLGEPGSGKTTTLKRIARELLTKAPSSKEDTYQFPVVLRLREIRANPSLAINLANALGIPYELKVITSRGHLSESASVVAMAGSRSLLDAVAEFLNMTGAVLLLDGLDEVATESRQLLETEIVALGLKLSNSKIILSTRSGDYAHHLEGFNIVEICPLTHEQIRAIAGNWVDNPEDFLRQLSNLPYYDVADRPLLLTQLLFLYRRNGYLPEQPVSIYEKLVNLLLQDWDAQKNVIRRSRYSGFTPERKGVFLAALAYHLTYKAKAKTFSGDDLVMAYEELYRLFNLPRQEARIVAQEIQSHSGLVVATRGDSYEFAHLSLQEYLCAQYIVREPFPEELEEYLASYSSPLAVAVALSSNAGNWFGGLILKERNFRSFTPESLYVFLSRLVLEQPNFGRSVFAGLSFCKIFFECRGDRFPYQEKAHSIQYITLRLAEREGALESIEAALFFFKVDVEASKGRDYVVLRRRLYNTNQYGMDTPAVGLLPLTLARILSRPDSTPFSFQDEKGSLQPYIVEG